MPEYNAGDAKLRIVPDAANFQKDLEAKLKTMKVDFTVRLNIEMAQAKADMARFRAEQDDRTINQRVNPQFTRANEEMAAWRAEQRTNTVNVPVKVDPTSGRSSAKAAVAEIGQEFGKLMGATMDLGKVMGITSLVASLPGAVNAIVGLTGAIEQLGGAALVVPGLIGGMAASFGTLAVGLSGVMDAFTAMNVATTQSSATAAASTAAQNSLRNAVVDEGQAQKAVTQARKDSRRSLEDLNIQLRGGHLSEAEAINAAKAARRDLAQGTFKDAIDREAAQLRVQEADQRVVESHQSLLETTDKVTDANAKGVEGSDVVVAAKEREVRALQAVATAQNALAGVNGADKAADALARLSKPAADFIDALKALKPEWIDLQKTVSGNLFEGAAGSFTTFVDSVLPNLKSGMGNIATAWNLDIKTLLSSLGSDSSKGLLDRILGNTSDAQTKFAAAIDPLVHGIGVLVAAGSDSLPRLATAIGDIATRFSNFIDAADKDGRLQGWISSGLDGFTHLGSILLNLGDSIHSITSAFGGGGFLASFDKMTARWATFLGSAKGQNDLKRIFEEGRQAIDKITPIVKDLGPILGGVFTTAVGAAEVFLPVLTEVADVLASHPALVVAISTAFVAWKTISPIVDGVKATIGFFTTSLLNVSTGFQPIRDKAAAAMKETGDAFDLAGGDSTKGVGKFGSKVASLSAYAGPLGLLVSAGIPLVAAFISSYNSKMDEGVAHAKHLAEESNNLLTTLENITNLAGQQTAKQVATALTNFDPGPGAPQGAFGGDVLKAAGSIGIGGVGGNELTTAILPGGENMFADQMRQVRDKLRPSIEKAFGNNQNLKDAGIGTDLLIDVTLGVEGAQAKLDAALEGKTIHAGRSSVPLSTVFAGDRLKDVVTGAGADAVAASTVGSAMLAEQKIAADAAAKANAERGGAAPPKQLRGEFANLFPGGADVQTDGKDVVITTTSPTQPGPIDGIPEAPVQNRAPNEDKWTYRLTPEEAAKFTFEKGGPTNAGLAVLHDDEFVLSARASKYPASFKHALNEGRIDPKALPHFVDGGSHLDPGYAGPGPGAPEIAAPPPATPAATDPTAPLPFNVGSFIGGMLGIPALGGFTNSDGTPRSIMGTNPDDGRTTIGGHSIGLDPKLAAGDPAAVKDATAYIKNWGINTLQSAGQIAIGGVLGGIGLPGLTYYSKDVQTGLGFITGGGDGGSAALGTAIDPATGLPVPTYGTSQVAGSTPGGAAPGSFSQAPGGDFIAQNAGGAAQLAGAFNGQGGSLDMTPALLASKGIKPLYNWGPGATAEGNVPPWVKTLASQFGLTASTYDNGETLHVGGYAWDFNGPKDKMDAFATFIQTHLAGQTLQLIHADGDQRWGIAGGQQVGPGTSAPNYYSNDWGGHFDHVHWATNSAVNISATDQTGAGSGSPYAPVAGGGAGTAVVGSSGALKTKAHAAYLAAGMPPAEWSDFDRLIQAESGWQPGVKNAGSTAYGLGQFLDQTWASVGGVKTSDPMVQLPLIFKYLQQRTDYHGSPSAAWALWQARSPHWYDQGGILPPGATMAMNATGQNERILNPAQNAHYEAMLPHFLDGGPFKSGVVMPPVPVPKPPPIQIPDIKQMIPRIPMPPPPGTSPTTPPAGGPPPAPGDDTPPPQAASETPQDPNGPAGAPPDSTKSGQSHLLPAIETGIKSGASAIGNAVSTAASIGMMGAGGGGAGSMISGLFNLGGKVVTDAANVAASFLVGTVSNIGGDTGSAYGRTYHAPQAQPATANSHTTNYNGGMVVADPQEMRREMDLRDAQHNQSIMANH